MKDITIRVTSQKGDCAAGHVVGYQWTINDSKTPGGICLAAFQAIYPSARVLGYDGVFPWEDDKDVCSSVACPDAINPVVFELRR